jgi:single-strand DNA-binding protein
MSGINSVVLVGRLTKDPELKYTPSGVAVASFTLAVNRNFTNQAGEKEADFINCVVWRRPAENVANFLKKGSMAGVTGRIQTRNFEGQDGRRIFITEVVCESVQFLDQRTSNDGESDQGNQRGNQRTNNNQGDQNGPGRNQSTNNNWYQQDSHGGQPIDISDDDLPF